MLTVSLIITFLYCMFCSHVSFKKQCTSLTMHCDECTLRMTTYLLSGSHFTVQRVQVLYDTSAILKVHKVYVDYNILVYCLSRAAELGGLGGLSLPNSWPLHTDVSRR